MRQTWLIALAAGTAVSNVDISNEQRLEILMEFTESMYESDRHKNEFMWAAIGNSLMFSQQLKELYCQKKHGMSFNEFTNKGK